MNFVEHVRVRQKRAKARFGAEVNRSAAVLDAREISRIGIPEDPSAEGDEAGMFLCFLCLGWHTLLFRGHFRDKHFIRVDRQPVGRFGGLEPLRAGEYDLQLTTFDTSGARKVQVELPV